MVPELRKRKRVGEGGVLSSVTFTVGVADTLGGPALLQRSEMALHRARLSGPGSIDNCVGG